MPFPTVKSYFIFTATQRSGIFLLLTIIIAFQLFFFFGDFSSDEKLNPEKQQWLSLQTQIDSLKQEKSNLKPEIYPFNPNFITDYKGYRLGMSPEEIDRLLAFRKTNKYVNSSKEFQQVTQVSDSLLNKIAPYFKFPDWVGRKRAVYTKFEKRSSNKSEKVILKDINHATAEDLIKVYGIGPALSERILKEREKLGGFVSMEQMKEVWGLSPEVIENLNKSFTVSVLPKVKKINVNSASVKELSQFPFFRYALAKEIVAFRSMNGEIKDESDLLKISGFPVDKVKVIAVYLAF